jgi:hypothetical protein
VAGFVNYFFGAGWLELYKGKSKRTSCTSGEVGLSNQKKKN